MKKKAKTALSARLTALCMAVLMAFSLLPSTASAAEGTSFGKITGEAEFTTGSYVMVTDTGYAPQKFDNNWLPADELGTALGDTIPAPADETVWEIAVSGGTATIKDMDGHFLAPKGGNENGIRISDTEYQWKWECQDGKFTFSGQGDDTVILASNRSSQNKFRAYKTTTVSGNPNGYPSEFTLYRAVEGGTSEGTVAAPQADPQAGAVASGTEITLTTSTSGALIYYTLDGSDPSDETNAARELYGADNMPVITEDCTLKAAAVLEGVYSAVQTLQYTVSGSGEPGDTAPIADGERVVIYAPAYGKALSAEYNGYYNKGTDVTEESDGTLSGYTDADVWTVAENEDGTYSFSHNGQKIGMGDSFSSMPLGEKNDKWILEDAGNGLYYVKNTVRGAYMEWYDSNGNWSAYYNIAEGSEGMFALNFYKVTDVPGGSDEPDEPSAVEGLEVEASPQSGASVVAGQQITLKAADGAQIYYTMNTDGTEPADPEAGNADQLYSEPLEIAATPEKDQPVVVKALAYIPQSGDAEAQTGEVYTFTYKAPMQIGDYGLYFGQLHAHTNLSDGTGTVEQAFEHAADVPNLDFLALTDHSNSFEGQSGLPSAGTTHLGDENAEEVNASWAEGREGARAITAQEGDFVGIYGFEMTWSGGAPGHINTFNSEGFENRNAAPYKKGDNYEVLEAYYDTLNANPETISQFNHPGDTFGDFMDFALYDPVIDNQITLIEVGNGEGAIGSSGYFPSYSYYTRALDKGWHVAPTNNQDNHKGNWGDSNTARSVVLSDGLSEEAIYDAMKNYRVYATEDNDLSILYSLNGNAMGSILDEQEKIHITAEISDPTDTAGETKVEVIVNGGQTLAEKTFTGGSATVEFDNLSTGYGYYYLRVTQADKNIAVTAPVWTGESVNAGISNTSSDVAMPIRGDEIQISSQIFNNLSDDMTVTSLTYKMEGQTEPFHTADAAAIGENGVIGARASYEYSFPYTADQAGGFNINAELKATIGGEEYTFTDVLKLSVSDPSIATKVLVDGTHYNDYVNGYYSGNMTNFINMGTSDNIQVKIVQPGEEVTAEMLEDVALFVISAPLKYTSDYTGDAQPSTFEDGFIQVVSDYVNGGGRVVVCGLADYQDANSGLPYTSYAQANALLEGIGSTMHINDDELIDQDENGGQPYRLYFDDFNYESTDPAVQSILAGVKESGLAYSSYSGCSVSVGEGEAIVYGHDTTYSINSKAPAQGHDKPVLSYSAAYDPNTAVVQKGDVVSMATEAVGEGRVYACGTVFCSNFEVAAEDQVSYANGIMAQNLLSSVKAEPVISTIQEARAGADGEVFTVVGTVANGTAESGNAFFNTIYIQDEEGNGINVFPIDDSNIRRGDQVQVTGSVSEYIGDKQLSAINVTVLEGNKDVVITDTTTKEANDYETNFGKLVRVKGEVTAVTMAGGIVESITVQDDSGEACRVFIDGYITYSDEASQALEEFVKEGAYISAVGFVSHDAEGNRLRVRDRSEILPAEEGEEPAPGGDQPGSETDRPGSGQQDGNTQTDGSQTGNGAQQAGAAVKDPVSAAQTGDNASVGVWIAIAVTAVLAAGAAAVVIVVGKRRRQRES
ncbi:CehA/McbA family metallohydrolase [Lachnoclostridium sp. An76]|uniref:CehA/McbA family metallohydrolase n=1 Tax=Lachnoclostridium sp. An76 TaxID=1965654 RepID=UPI0013A617DD|nr:CehA/McbA family metallohydrolase [Lachnoclostridium sp. An76]